jgi:mono/diheme cytochrome c family protein
MKTPAHSKRPARRWGMGLAAMMATLTALAAWIAWLNVRGEDPLDGTEPTFNAQGAVERGAYLARAGNCAGCHSTPGGAAFTGGRGVETPFGVVYAPNLTPDTKTGIGAWSAGEFWRAMHHGRSKSGRLLYPAFPYPSYTQLTRDDSDALYAYLRTVPPVERPNTAHALRFPFSTQVALAVWRALFFRPGAFTHEPTRSAPWNRGKYLVQVLGHCTACHSARNALGATPLNAEFAGGLMPDESWYAPSLASPDEAGVQRWKTDDLVALLKNGITGSASVSGPMAEVVFNSTQHLSAPDLEAMAQYLADIPARALQGSAFRRGSADALKRGEALYAHHCAACHGGQGQGVAGIYPALAGNRAVTLHSPANVVQLIRLGGFSPSTAGNPRPFGMPPFAQSLSTDDIAAVSTFIRQSWGNRADEVTPLEVLRVR